MFEIMSRNIFLDKNQFVPNPKRNSYDKSKLVNGTYKAGFIYPIDWEEVTFGDSIKLDLSLALRTMPMVWPIQTPVIAKVYSFYVRYRTLMKDFTDFRFNNKQVTHPFIALNAGSDFWKTGELGDHLGIPTTYASPSSFLPSHLVVSGDLADGSVPVSYLPAYASTAVYNNPFGLAKEKFTYTSASGYYPVRFFEASESIYTRLGISQKFRIPYFFFNHVGAFKFMRLVKYNGAWLVIDGLTCNLTDWSESWTKFFDVDFNAPCVTSGQYPYIFTNYALPSSVHTYSEYLNWLNEIDSEFAPSNCESCFAICGQYLITDSINPANVEAHPCIVHVGDGIFELSNIRNPFSSYNPEIPLSALIPRAYEACYRSHFQDLTNEPFIIDGVPQYNRYITNDGNGADTTDYKLFRRNWEADFLTSAKPSPQQGMAPIVGLTADGTITLVNTEGNEYKVQLVTDSNDVITNYDLATQRGESDYSVRRTLLELATTGFTINSLRNTNAFQQWLEANYRHGLKFRDQVLSNFGVKLEYKELDMPEFLGGFSIPLNVDQVAQTSSSVDGAPLGDLAGNGALFGKQKHSITHYCDEEGVVMTLMCITPIPVYSQLLNRCWLKSSPVDYYNPSFGKIGNQPITFEEVCPVQAYNEGKDVHDVFGYQRPWYHMISSVDEVHGMMRNNMSGFLMQRIFGSTPELGASFLHIDESQMNDVFVARNSAYVDNYYGQIGIKKYKKTCIPRYALPALN